MEVGRFSETSEHIMIHRVWTPQNHHLNHIRCETLKTYGDTKWFIVKLFVCSLNSFGLQKIKTDPQTKDRNNDYDKRPNLLGGNKEYIKDLRRNSFHTRIVDLEMNVYPTGLHAWDLKCTYW